MLSTPSQPPPSDEAADSDGERPLIRAGLRGFLDLDRFDVIAVVALVLIAFGLRFASPIFPDFLSGTGGVTALGVGYPYNSDPNACQMVPVGPGGGDACSTRCFSPSTQPRISLSLPSRTSTPSRRSPSFSWRRRSRGGASTRGRGVSA